MALLVRILLAVAGAAAAVLVGRDAETSGSCKGMLAVVVAVAVLILVGLSGRR